MGMNIFNVTTREAFLQSAKNTIEKIIKSQTKEYILNINPQEFKTFAITPLIFEELVFDLDQIEVKYAGKSIYREEKNNRFFERDVYMFELSFPFSGSYELLYIIPGNRVLITTNFWSTQSNNGRVWSDFSLNEQDPIKFEQEKQSKIKKLTANLNNANREGARYNIEVEKYFDIVFQKHKQKIIEEDNFLKAINIPINKTTQSIFTTPTIKKKEIPKPSFESKNKVYFSEPSLDNQVYIDVLKVTYDLYKSIEKKPSIYNSKDEEGLRDYLLPFLETRYDSSTVTGETFNKIGKTDILIKYADGSNLFVAECKYWRGQSEYSKAFNQLFDRYLTWRDSKTALILFVENNDFSKVIESINIATKEHKYFRSYKSQRWESSFSYEFKLPSDSERVVLFEVMLFHFPK